STRPRASPTCSQGKESAWSSISGATTSRTTGPPGGNKSRTICHASADGSGVAVRVKADDRAKPGRPPGGIASDAAASATLLLMAEHLIGLLLGTEDDW